MNFKPATILASLLMLGACERVGDADFDRRLHAYLVQHPEVIRDAAIKLRQKRAAEAAAVLKQAQPALERDARDFVANPGGRATVVQFFDYRCPYSRAMAPEIDRLIAQNPDVRFVFKQYPVFGSASDYAARVALTPQAKAKGLELHRALMGQKDLNAVRVDRIVRRLGLNPRDIEAASRTPAVDEQIRDTRALAQDIHVTGTPTFVVAGEIIPGADADRLDAAISRAKAQALSSVLGEALGKAPVAP